MCDLGPCDDSDPESPHMWKGENVSSLQGSWENLTEEGYHVQYMTHIIGIHGV